jgi:phosphoglycolate phosphatase-like HAD superfamily hydrolase
MSRALPHQPVALLLDFDGVIVQSVALKIQAFLDIYADASDDERARILEHQRAHGGVTRRIKFEYFEREVFRRPADAATLDRLAADYARRVHAGVLACPFVPGAPEFLEIASRRCDLHIVSGTPHAELEDIVARRGLARYVTTIAGAPETKRDAFLRILSEHGYPATRTLAVGDATTEYDAARELGIPFLGIVAEGDANRFPGDVPVLPTLERLAASIGFDRGLP